MTNSTTWKMNFLIYLFLLTSLNPCHALKILVMTPFSAKSHQNFIQPLIRELASRGHEITFYTSLPALKNVTNIKEIAVSDALADENSPVDFSFITKLTDRPFFYPPMLWFMCLELVDKLFQDPEVLKLVQSDEKYDLVMAETFFFQEAFVAFGHKFNAPVIALHGIWTNLYTSEYNGNSFGVSYLPVDFEVNYTDKMTFFQRVHNAIRAWINLIGLYTFYLPKQENFIRKYFNYEGAEKIPPLTDMLQDVSLIITNTQLSVDFPRPSVPNIISVAGLNISPTRKPLPEDLRKFMDNSKHGVIYFSFGSIVPTEALPDSTKNAFAKAFGKLKLDVLWKLPVDSFPGLPNNVKLGRWFPQQDILGHPNCKLFITHGGLMSQIEAVYFGVPVIGVPFFGDQFTNMNRATERGFAVSLDQYNITEQSVLWAINEVLSKKSYHDNIKKYSAIFHDRQNPPLETAIYWIEYVVRHKGAPHLRVEGRNLPYYKYLLVDVILFISAILFLVVFIFYRILKLLLCLICPSRNSKSNIKLSKKND